MKSNLLALALVAAIAGISAPAFADDAAKQVAQQVVPLKDGSNLFIFKDGKMAREDKFGRARSLKSGEVLEASDGRKWTATSNESARLNQLLKEGHRN